MSLRSIAVLVAALSLVAPLAACGDSDSDTAAPSAAPAARQSVQLVDVAAAQQLISDPAVVIIDVRTPEEFAEGYIDGAQLIDFKAADFRDIISKLDRDVAYFVYCRSGNRSGQATAIMNELGFTNVYDLDGGIVAWAQAGAPVVTS